MFPFEHSSVLCLCACEQECVCVLEEEAAGLFFKEKSVETEKLL